ncbi:hypothetical protein PLESTB_001082800 [Pleodorina starrii]|uniref:Uncharacterized protein n=1 Tax=Pleodorina starrii TaxID=330485 RepID=A0A9W6F579_9CHLO|nr:hypothetical protein PLESTM_001175900 [Pleodorina starrii]GLC56235.1 hypothetical protein PLESTB_001082800 [Pleodorina starrii]GLC69131.1 hypothetical protein PLESTF_000793300 [Pleodorina starrii]
MYGTEKPKAKALATASTLQKVVCPAPPADPQEILSNGWRKVGEQKRVTNRLANGHPDRGVGVSSREPSFKGKAASNRQNGREVLDKMFGHMRPHHIVTPAAVTRIDEQELENGLGSQAARAAFYRPAIGPALNELPSNMQQQLSGVAGSLSGSLELGAEIDAAGGGDVDYVQHSPSSPGTPSGGRGSHHRRNAAQLRQDSVARRNGSGASTPVGMSNGRERRGALPAVGRTHPSDGGAGGGGGGGEVVGRRRASISGGDTALPAIGPGAAGGPAGAAACGGGKGPMGRTRRTSLTLGYNDDHGSAAAVVLSNIMRMPRRMSLTGSGGGGGSPNSGSLGASPARAALRGGGPPPDGPASPNPALARIAQSSGASHSAPLLKAGLGSSFRHNSGGAAAAAAAAAATAAAAAAAAAEAAPSSTLATLGYLVQAAGETSVGIGGIGGGGLAGLGSGGGSGGIGANVGSGLIGAGGSGLSGGGGSGGVGGFLGGAGGSGGCPTSPGAAAGHSAVPLSGLENLAGTGLGDAISQLRNIRMAGHPGGGAAAAASAPKKAEPGLAGLTPLLPVPLPPLDNWQTGGKQVTDLDPCRGIRLVDAANYVLPRAAAEANLRVRMAQNQAAMRHLVKAEGAPMSDSEMEAVKLLGRLERSGARQRNFEAMDSIGAEGNTQGGEGGQKG